VSLLSELISSLVEEKNLGRDYGGDGGCGNQLHRLGPFRGPSDDGLPAGRELYLSPPIRNRKPSELVEGSMLESNQGGRRRQSSLPASFCGDWRMRKLLLSRMDHKDLKLVTEEADAL
jgi:hypothetical protein